MALQLKQDNNPTPPVSDSPVTRERGCGELDVTQIHNMERAVAQSNRTNQAFNMVVKIVVLGALIVVALLGGSKLKDVIAPEGTDITNHLANASSVLPNQFGTTFAANPEWQGEVVEYSRSHPVVQGDEDFGIVYIDSREVGVHIHSNKYSIFGIQVGDGEKHVYDNTTYPFEEVTSILETMEGKETVYIYYNTERNDCIVLKINNTTNRVSCITYYNNYLKVSEELSRV